MISRRTSRHNAPVLPPRPSPVRPSQVSPRACARPYWRHKPELFWIQTSCRYIRYTGSLRGPAVFCPALSAFSPRPNLVQSCSKQKRPSERCMRAAAALFGTEACFRALLRAGGGWWLIVVAAMFWRVTLSAATGYTAATRYGGWCVCSILHGCSTTVLKKTLSLRRPFSFD